LATRSTPSETRLPANWIKCDTCRRVDTWWGLNTLACTHRTGCALDDVVSSVLARNPDNDTNGGDSHEP
jgi:hypothetical protein